MDFRDSDSVSNSETYRFVWLGIFGHPDDETSASAGTMVKWIKKGGEVHVVTATGGEEGTLGTGQIVIERDDLARVRELELKKNLALYGANPPFMLRYRDKDLNKENTEVLSTKVLDIMQTVEPDVVVTFGPSGISNHPDHIAIHKATVVAYKNYRDAVSKPDKPILLYPAIPSDIADLYGLELSEEEKQMDIVIDIEETITLKIQGLKNYSSQEDAQEFAERLSQRDDSTEGFAVSRESDHNWQNSRIVSYLRSL